jgi:hypothetical protein
MVPHQNEKHRFYLAERNWDLLGNDPTMARGRQSADWRPNPPVQI